MHFLRLPSLQLPEKGRHFLFWNVWLFHPSCNLLIGVIPSSGGTGSTELVFLMLFGSMTEKVRLRCKE